MLTLSIGPIVETECEILSKRAKVGLALIGIGFFILYFGTKENFGYLSEYTEITLFVSGGLVFIGALRIALFMRCIVNYNSKY